MTTLSTADGSGGASPQKSLWSEQWECSPRMSCEAKITQTDKGLEGAENPRAKGSREVCEEGLEDSRQTGPATLMANLSGPVPASTAEPSLELI